MRIGGRIYTITMGSTEQDSLANRDTPIPVLQIHPADDSTPTILTPSTENGSSHRLSASKLKDKLESLGDKSGRDSAGRMGDKMFNLYVQFPNNTVLRASSNIYALSILILEQPPLPGPSHRRSLGHFTGRLILINRTTSQRLSLSHLCCSSKLLHTDHVIKLPTL